MVVLRSPVDSVNAPHVCWTAGFGQAFWSASSGHSRMIAVVAVVAGMPFFIGRAVDIGGG
jgi:hypothetical protein